MRRALLLVPALLMAAPVAAQAAAPAAAPAAPSPRAQQLAERIALAQLPPGAYARMFQGMGDSINRQAASALLQTPIRDLARLGGVPEEKLAGVGEATLRQVVALVDPAFEARLAAVGRVTMEVMGELFSSLEPEFRQVFAGVYARSYSEADLEAIAAFYATPTGQRFAARQLEMMADPAVQKATAEMMPRMMQALAGAGPRIEQATRHLPPPRTAEQMTPAERERALALLNPPSPAGKTAS